MKRCLCVCVSTLFDNTKPTMFSVCTVGIPSEGGGVIGHCRINLFQIIWVKYSRALGLPNMTLLCFILKP